MIFMKNKETTIRETMRLNIIAKRKERNWTQSDLANILKSKKNTIASWEQGLSSPDIDTIAILLKLFDMSFYEFTGIKE
jgi:Helix-turn-helix.